ncbi:MAG: hypothetical protein ACUVXF_12260 [Desulfobaccales bacterium]
MSRGQIIRALALLALLAVVLIWAVWCCQIPLNRLAAKLGRPLMGLSLAIGIGLLLGIFIESADFTARLGRLFAPLLRFGHLKEPSALAFTSAFFSAVTASTVLMNAYQDGTISRRELVLSGLILTFPAFFAHLPTLFFIITPLVGVLGVYYLAILLGGDVLRTAAYLLYGRLTLPPYQPRPLPPTGRQVTWGEIWRATRSKFISRLYAILIITIPVFVAVFLAQEGGLFTLLNERLAALLRGTPIPAEAVSILVFSLAAEATGGFAAAGALLTAQALSPGAVLFTLLLGTIISSPMRAIRHQMPYYFGVYTPALGLRLMILSQFFRIVSLLPFLGVIYLWGL